jgi:hypothetical protein
MDKIVAITEPVNIELHQDSSPTLTLLVSHYQNCKDISSHQHSHSYTFTRSGVGLPARIVLFVDLHSTQAFIYFQEYVNIHRNTKLLIKNTERRLSLVSVELTKPSHVPIQQYMPSLKCLALTNLSQITEARCH